MPSGIIATIELAEEDKIALAQIPVPIVQLWLHILSFGSDGETQKDVFGFVGEASFKSDLRLLAYEKFPEENADPVDVSHKRPLANLSSIDQGWSCCCSQP